MLNISHLRAFLTFQRKHFANSPSLLLSTRSSSFWAITCLQWTIQQLQVPLSLLLWCLTLLLLLLLLSHRLSTISPLQSLPYEPLQSKGHLRWQHRTTCHPLKLTDHLKRCRAFLFNDGPLFDAVNSALLHFCSIKHMLNSLATLYMLKIISEGDTLLGLSHSSQRLL